MDCGYSCMLTACRGACMRHVGGGGVMLWPYSLMDEHSRDLYLKLCMCHRGKHNLITAGERRNAWTGKPMM